MTADKIKALLAEQLRVDIEKISNDTDIIDELGADSLDVVELIASLEEEFDVVILDESANELRTVGQLAEFIDSLM